MSLPIGHYAARGLLIKSCVMQRLAVWLRIPRYESTALMAFSSLRRSISCIFLVMRLWQSYVDDKVLVVFGLVIESCGDVLLDAL